MFIFIYYRPIGLSPISFIWYTNRRVRISNFTLGSSRFFFYLSNQAKINQRLSIDITQTNRRTCLCLHCFKIWCWSEKLYIYIYSLQGPVIVIGTRSFFFAKSFMLFAIIAIFINKESNVELPIYRTQSATRWHPSIRVSMWISILYEMTKWKHTRKRHEAAANCFLFFRAVDCGRCDFRFCKNLIINTKMLSETFNLARLT